MTPPAPIPGTLRAGTVARGGSDADSNLCVACRDCNLSKGAKPLKEWEAAR